ncbi:MAG: hypothetical protein GY757_44145 [bacterium]|nr:hypothetical protein [bacterium]
MELDGGLELQLDFSGPPPSPPSPPPPPLPAKEEKIEIVSTMDYNSMPQNPEPIEPPVEEEKIEIVSTMDYISMPQNPEPIEPPVVEEKIDVAGSMDYVTMPQKLEVMKQQVKEEKPEAITTSDYIAVPQSQATPSPPVEKKKIGDSRVVGTMDYMPPNQENAVPAHDEDRIKVNAGDFGDLEIDRSPELTPTAKPAGNTAPQKTAIPKQAIPKPPIPKPPVPKPPVPAAPALPQKSLNISKAIPIKVDGSRLHLNVENVGERALGFEKIKAVGAVKISSQTKHPFLLIDLFLSDPSLPVPQISLIRISSTNFDPQKLIPSATKQLEAFKIFISAIIRTSKSKPYPDEDTALLKKVKTFPTSADYDRWLTRLG